MAYLLELLLLPIVLFFLFWVILKKPLKALLWSSLISLIVVIIFGIIVYKDAAEFAARFPEQPKLFLFDEKGKIVGGLTLTTFNITTDENGVPKFDLLEDSEISLLDAAYAKKDYKAMLGSHYMVIVFKSEVFEGIESSVPGAIGAFLGAINSKFTTLMYMDKFSKLVEQKGPLVFLQEYKKGHVIIYPEILTFKIFKDIPQSLFDRVSQTVLAQQNNTEQK